MSRELLQQALGALGTSTWDHTRAVGKQELITALRAALAQPEPVPVARCVFGGDNELGTIEWLVRPAAIELKGGDFLYATPPAAPVDGFGGNLDEAFEPAAPAVCCRNELLTALHTLASNYENALGMFGQDGEGRRKAEGDLAHAMKVAAKHNRNGPGCAAPAVPSPNKPTVQRLMDLARKFRSAPGDLYDDAYKELERACYEALSAAPAVPLTDDMVEKEFVSRGDGRGQGLHPYWKSAFREGWHFARAMIAASPPAPAVAEPLSDERIDEIFEGAHENMPKGVLFRTFIARAIEQAHGIGGGGK